METATQERTSRTFEQATIANGEAAALSLGITQRVIGPLTELALATAKEHTRLAAELQVAALEALHESQATALRQLAQWPDVAADPLHLWHRGLAESFDSAQRAPDGESIVFIDIDGELIDRITDDDVVRGGQPSRG